MAQAKKLTLVDLNNIITVISSDTLESCGARATYSDQSTHIWGYSFSTINGRLHVFFMMLSDKTAEN